jgi:two-component system, NarL family, vancomycin resistance associated response regulator VraR
MNLVNLSPVHSGNALGATTELVDSCKTVLIVDDNELVRISLKFDLKRFTDIHVIGMATNGREAIQLAASLQPDVILMDLQMPIMDGLTAANLIKQSFAHIQIIAYTSLGEGYLNIPVGQSPFDLLCSKDLSTDALVELILQS